MLQSLAAVCCCCRSYLGYSLSNITASMQVRQCSMSAQHGLRHMAQPFRAAPRPFTGPNTARQQQSRATAVAAFACSSRGFAAAAARQINAAPLSSSGSSRRTRKMVVRANWGAPVDFTTAKLMSNSKVAQQLHKVVVDVGNLAAGYAKGGQFMQIKVSASEDC
jgi:hypothetical protein